ncbi:hypothetical protein [Marinobacter caseinilyticus]|uniref:hypothetical protein n=1 Tax=Marinobacter caseinilyticus TaxID=2692195 RepID=UPI00140E3E95|nr:hypothetical protein [Marinobacter caseinilyticus]
MANLSTGAKHYVLMLIPGLLREIDEFGLRHVIDKSHLSEQDVTSLYFDFVVINRRLPEDPEVIDPDLWGDLVHCVQILSTLVNEAAQDDLTVAREQAISQFLPHARSSLKHEFERRRKEGTVDFRLAGIARLDASADHNETVCMEAIKLERQQRFDSMMKINPEGLTRHQASIVDAAKQFARQHMTDPPEAFGLLDLLIRLVDLLKLVLILERSVNLGKATLSGNLTIENIVLGIGNILYREELGLKVSPVAQTRKQS